MTAELSREEAQALLSHDAPRGDVRDSEVSTRDFTRPRRLSRPERQRLARSVEGVLPQLEGRLQAWLREGLRLELEQVDEVNALALFDGLKEPFVVQSLSAGGKQGWLVVPNQAALALAEQALGASASPDERITRPLSPIEAGLVADILGELAVAIGGALGLELRVGALLQRTRALELDLEADLGREPERVAFYVTLAGKELSGATLRLYLPGILPTPNAAASARRPPKPLPAHLGPVPVELSAELGSIDVPLSELLALEVGDVVPLGAAFGEAATIRVEDRPCGRAIWGSHRGGLALRILNFQPPEEE